MKPKNQRIAKKEAMIKVEKFLSKIKYLCLYDDCKEKAIKSHSQQRNGPLKNISERNKVFRLNDDLQRSLNIETDQIEYRFSLKGIGESSTFPGFCEKHETIFSEFETKELTMDNQKQALLLFYRTVCYEKSRKRKEYMRWTKLVEELSDVWGGLNVIRVLPQIEAYNNHIKFTADPIINSALGMIKSGNYEGLTTRWVKIDHNVNVSCSTTINLHLDNFYEYAAKNRGKPLPLFTFNLVPYKNSTYVIFSWLSEFDEHAVWLEKAITDNNQLEYYINRFCFCDSEDVCINPSLWNSVSDQKKFIDNMRHVFERGELSPSTVSRLIRLNN